MSVLWTSAEALEATGGEVTNDWSANGVSIDSRTLKEGDLFVALAGPNFDGHDYVAKAFETGASAAVVSKMIPDYEGRSLLVVDDTQNALEDLAKYARRRTHATIIGVTGSVGKTSVKDGVAFVLSYQGMTHASEGNLNNHIGLPLSLVRMPADTEYGVFELGMNHAGELSALTQILRPHVAVITAIEAVHLEFFDSVEAIADAKAEIFEGLEPKGVAVLPFDSPHYARLNEKATACGGDIVSFGETIGANCYLSVHEAANVWQNVVVEINGRKIEYTLVQTGKHHVINSLAILATVMACDANTEKASMQLSELTEGTGRGKQYALESGVLLLDDSYNASPVSIRAGLSSLHDVAKHQDRKAIAVLGDMLELGDGADQYHVDLAKDISFNDVDLVFTAGRLMANLHEVLPDEVKGVHCTTAMELLPVLQAQLQEGDVVLIKGSHGSEMWKLAAALREG